MGGAGQECAARRMLRCVVLGRVAPRVQCDNVRTNLMHPRVRMPRTCLPAFWASRRARVSQKRRRRQRWMPAKEAWLQLAGWEQRCPESASRRRPVRCTGTAQAAPRSRASACWRNQTGRPARSAPSATSPRGVCHPQVVACFSAGSAGSPVCLPPVGNGCVLSARVACG